MHLGSKKCLSALWIVAAALQQWPRIVETGVCYSSTAWFTVAKF